MVRSQNKIPKMGGAMKHRYAFVVVLALAMFGAGGVQENGSAPAQDRTQASLVLQSNVLEPDPAGANDRSLRLDGIFYETAEGRVLLPAESTEGNDGISGRRWEVQSNSQSYSRIPKFPAVSPIH